MTIAADTSRPASLPATGRIAVIGAGAVGLSCALHLRRHGLDVDIYDLRPPGEGASRGNAGILATSEVLPIGRPAILARVPAMLFFPTGPLAIRARYLPRLAPWLLRMLWASRAGEVARISGHLSGLLALALPAWKELIRASPAQALLHTDGWLKAFCDGQAFERAAADAAILRELGVRVEALDGGAVADIEPALAPLAGGLLFPDCGNLVTPLAASQALAAEARKAGVTFYRREVLQLGSAPASFLKTAEGGEATYDRIVVAAGAWSGRLLRSMGVSLPLDTERGYHLMLPTPERILRRPVTLPAPGYTLTQMPEGVRLTTGVEFAGLDAPPDFRRAMRMAAHAMKALPGLSPQPFEKWLGFRPSMPDSMPVIGPLRHHPRIILALGHGHLGVTLGPVTGEIVAALVTGRPGPVDAAPLSPSRFGA